MSAPIINPSVPYVGTMRVFGGQLLKIVGTPRYQASRFAINLQTGPNVNPRDDIALHLSPCFNPPSFKRNSLICSSWGPEDSSGPFLFRPGQRFELMILCQEYNFKIAIDGRHLCDFDHRIAMEEISHLTIDGDVDIHSIMIFDNTQISPTTAPQPTQVQPPMNQPIGFYPQQGGLPPQPQNPAMNISIYPPVPPPPHNQPYPSGGTQPQPGYNPSPYMPAPGGYPIGQQFPSPGGYPTAPNYTPQPTNLPHPRANLPPYNTYQSVSLTT